MKSFVNPEEAVRRRNLLIEARKAQVNAVKDARMRAFQYAVAQAQVPAVAQAQKKQNYTFVKYEQVIH